jgi:putative ABC transport system substrate-binding protein
VIPIIFATAGDPVGNNLVASLAQPGGNVTGLSLQMGDLTGKRLELLREVVPGLRRVAIMANVGNPFTVLELGEVQAAAGTLGLELVTLEIRHAQDIVPAFEALKGRSEALYVCTDALINTNRIRINILAVGARLPTMHGSRDYVETGGLMSYGVNFPDLFRRRRRLCRQDSARDEAGQHPRRTADQVRSHYQPDDRQSAWPRDPRKVPAARQ